MRILLVLTVLLGSIAAGCQNPDLTSTPQTGNTFPDQNASTPAPTQTPQSSRKSAVSPAAQSSKQVATISTSPTSNQRACDIGAYVIDKDPQGLNVRSGPSSNDRVIAKLPTTTLSVMVDITASQGSWVQLSRAESPEKVEFQGTGWVYAQLLGTNTRGYESGGVSVYPTPNTQSSAIGRIPANTSVKLLGCEQSWAFVEYQGLKGWLTREDQCPVSLTTCS